MRRNRRIKKNSRFATSSMGIASLIISAFIMMMIFFAMNSRCSAITREIGKKEKVLQRLESELTREKTRWDEMKVPERLNVALARFGLEMDFARGDQIVRMGRNGAPVPGQLALTRLRGSRQVAGVSSATTPTLAHTQVRRSRVSPSVVRRQSKNGVRK